MRPSVRLHRAGDRTPWRGTTRYTLGMPKVTGFLVCILMTATAFGTSISRAPRPTALLSNGEFLAQDSFASVTHYDGAGRAIRTYSADNWPAMAVTADGSILAMACRDGSVRLYQLRTGTHLWTNSPKPPELLGVQDVSFAANGKSLVVCDGQDRALVFDTASGKQIGAARFPAAQSGVASAALSPDGTSGVLVDAGGRVYSFDPTVGTPAPTGVRGAGPIRYSSDGRYVALRSANSGSSESLRILDTADMRSFVDVGRFSYIGHMAPSPDGSFRVTAREFVARGSGIARVLCAVCDPTRSEPRVLWTAPPQSRTLECKSDFDPQSLVGVSTDFRLITSVIDLSSGRTLVTIDNSANYAAAVARSRFANQLPGLVLQAVVVVVIVIGAIVAVARLLRLRARRGSGARCFEVVPIHRTDQ